MSKRIRELSECDLRTLLAELDRDRSLPHAGTNGASREDLLVRLLGKHLPGRYGISSGHLITADNQWSKQQDVIIYDRFNSPLVEDLGHEKIIFVESTLVAGEGNA